MPENSRTTACIFCDVTPENGFQVLWESDTYVAFKDHRPACKYHFLVIPKEHKGNVRSLGQSDAAMLREMHDVGRQLMLSYGVPPIMQRMGFHVAPFHSVEHLHMHVHGLPYTSPWRAAKYPTFTGFITYTKGLSWFVEVQQAIQILEQGKCVRILPC